MTAMPEAKLAREAELPYAILCMVTDYDCWRAETEAVSVTNVLEIMGQNSALARKAVAVGVHASMSCAVCASVGVARPRAMGRSNKARAVMGIPLQNQTVLARP